MAMKEWVVAAIWITARVWIPIHGFFQICGVYNPSATTQVNVFTDSIQNITFMCCKNKSKLAPQTSNGEKMIFQFPFYSDRPPFNHSRDPDGWVLMILSIAYADGFWAAWGPWGTCSKTCGGGGEMTKIRECKAGSKSNSNCKDSEKNKDAKACNQEIYCEGTIYIYIYTFVLHITREGTK